MSACGPTLGPDWELVLEGEQALVRRRSDGQAVAALDGAEAVVLGLMDGTRSHDELDALLDAALGPEAKPYLVKLRGRLGPLLAEGPPRPCPHALEALARARRPAHGSLRPWPGPRVLHWWVTSACPRRCLYCFANPVHTGRADDAVLTRDRLREILREAASLGAETLLVAGAEPLLRPDLPEVMGDAIAAGITPVLTTKHPISARLAKRFAEAGVPHVSLSIDSMREDVNEQLIGSRTYAEQVRRSVAHLRAAGVAFSFQSVVTAQDPSGFVDVVAFAARAGAHVVQVVPFEPVLHPIGHLDNEQMALCDRRAVEDAVRALDAEYADLRVELFQELGSEGRGGLECDVGMTKMFFLANGVVHRCYKLIHDRRLDGRDLRTISVAAAWHDPAFTPVISPPRSEYTGSACATCASFDGCHADGRCIYRAFLDHGAYARPDRRCANVRERMRLPVL
jgi:pyrroloquinoline quinone biosynthesis protein E